MQILVNLAAKANWRHDAKILLQEVEPTLQVAAACIGRNEFVDLETNEATSDIAYEFNELCENGLIKPEKLYAEGVTPNILNETPKFTGAVSVTRKGFDAVTDWQRPWLAKAIEKQPMTFVQIVVTVMLAILSGLGGWAVGRYLTPVTEVKTVREVD